MSLTQQNARRSSPEQKADSFTGKSICFQKDWGILFPFFIKANMSKTGENRVNSAEMSIEKYLIIE